jgi:hypothetical protein
MKRSPFVLIALLVVAVASPSISRAETYSEVYNGANCIPYPPFNSNNAVPYSSWLYGFGQSAYCHFTIPNTWTAKQISYVLFEGASPSDWDNIRVRLCVYYRLTQTCGAERTIAGSSGVNWVDLPASMPTYVTGAYLSVAFPNTGASAFMNYIPVWHRPTIIAAHLSELASQALLQIASDSAENSKWEASLRTAFEVEARVDSWAGTKEAQLREAATRIALLPEGTIQNLECRQSQCRAAARLPASLDPRALNDRLMKMKTWIETDAECSYTLLHSLHGDAHDVEVFTSCGKR